VSERNEEKFNLIKIIFEAPGEILYGEISSEGVVSQNVADASEDFKWLIERVQELENRIQNKILPEIEKGNEQNMQLREVLTFYSDSKNYEVNVVDQWGPEIKVMMDGGAKAAELLEGLK